MKKPSNYIIVAFNGADGVFYHTVAGNRTRNINEAHRNRCGRKNIERDHAPLIKDGSVTLIEKQGFFI